MPLFGSWIYRQSCTSVALSPWLLRLYAFKDRRTL